MATGDRTIACTTPAWADRLALPAIFAVVVLELLAPESVFAGAAALAAAAIMLARMLGWQSLKTLSMPLVWILHVGYLWLPLGFLLKGLADLGVLNDPASALHALTTGAVGVMVLAVGSRAALGHSGRPLVATRATVVVYFLVLGAAIMRVFVPFDWALAGAAVLWTAGWGLFAIVYWPVLARPRIDGQPD